MCGNETTARKIRSCLLGQAIAAGQIAAGGAAAGRARRWTADEAQRFGELMARSRKDAARVARELGGGRTIGDVLAFYYGKWKQTDAYRALKAQMRAESQRSNAAALRGGVDAHLRRNTVLHTDTPPGRGARSKEAKERPTRRVFFWWSEFKSRLVTISFSKLSRETREREREI